MHNLKIGKLGERPFYKLQGKIGVFVHGIVRLPAGRTMFSVDLLIWTEYYQPSAGFQNPPPLFESTLNIFKILEQMRRIYKIKRLVGEPMQISSVTT